MNGETKATKEPSNSDILNLAVTEGKNSKKPNKYYMDAFHAFENGKRLYWNFAAFFLSVPWLIYRRMYLVAFVYVVLWESISGGPELFMKIFMPESAESITIPGHFGPIISMIARFFFGAYGTYLYYKQLAKKLKKSAEYQRKDNLDFLSSALYIFIKILQAGLVIGTNAYPQFAITIIIAALIPELLFWLYVFVKSRLTQTQAIQTAPDFNS